MTRAAPAAIVLLVPALALVLVLGARSHGGERPISARDLVALETLAGVAFSPDGKTVAVAVSWGDLESGEVAGEIALVNVASGRENRLSDSLGTDALRFSADGRWLLYVAEEPLEDEDEPVSRLVAASVEGDVEVVLSGEDHVIAFDVAPDGVAYYVTEEPLEENGEDGASDAIVYGEPNPRREIKAARIEAEEEGEEPAEPRRIYLGDAGIEEIDVSPDGKRIVFETNGTGEPRDDDRYDIHVLDVGAKEARPLATRRGSERTPRFSPDSKQVAYTAPIDPLYDYSRWDVFVVSAAGGVEPRSVTAPSDETVVEIAWHPAGEAIYATLESRVDQPLVRFPLDPSQPPLRVASGEWSVRDFDLSPDGKRVAYVREGPAAPSRLFVASAVNDEGARSLGPEPRGDRHGPPLAGVAVPKMELLRWKSKDGLEIEGLLTRPPAAPKGAPLPLVVALHGGPSARAERVLVDEYLTAALAGVGYLVLQPNYRGSTGYGNAFNMANRADLGGGDLDDVLAGVDALVASGEADPERLALVGGSYGGYLVNFAVTQTTRFKAAVSMYGIFNWISDFGTTSVPTFERDYLGGFYWDRLELYLERSPFFHVKKVKTPMLLLHGELDDNISVGNAHELYQALRALEVPCRLVVYPREPHGLFEPAHQIDAVDRTLDWLVRYLGKNGERTP